MRKDSSEFIQLLTESQSALNAYVRALVPDAATAKDIVQETNLAIWNKIDEFEQGTNFRAWVAKIAYFQILRHRRTCAREKLFFDDDVLNILADENGRYVADSDNREKALLECLESLPEEHSSLLRQRYVAGDSIQIIASIRGKSKGAISQRLFRIRETLSHCMQMKLRRWEAS